MAREVFTLASEHNSGSALLLSVLPQGWTELPWYDSEARLFAATSIAQDVMADLVQELPESPQVDEALRGGLQAILSRQQQANTIAACGGLLYIAAYSGWLANTQGADQMLPAALSHIATMLDAQNEGVASNAASALSLLSRVCKDAFRDETLLRGMVERVAACRMQHLPDEGRTRLIEALARAIGAAPPVAAGALLELLMSPVLGHLEALRGQGAAANPQEASTAIEVLAASVKGIPPQGMGSSSEGTPQHPALAIVQRAWGSVLPLMEALAAHENVAESFARLCTAAMRSTQLAFSQLLQPTAQALVAQFMSQGFLCLLRGINTMVAIFGGVADMAGSFGEVLTAVSTAVFQRLGADRHQPDVVVSYFELVLAYLVCSTTAMVQHPLFPNIFELACSCLYLPEAPPLALVTQLLAWVTKKTVNGTAAEQQILQSVLSAHGQRMLCGLSYALAVSYPVELAPRAADVLAPLLAARKAEVDEWLRSALSAAELASVEALTPEVVQHIIGKISARAGASAEPAVMENLRQLLMAFASVCRKKRPVEILASFS